VTSSADLEDLARVIDPTPGHVGDMEESVDPAQIHEGAVLGEVLDDAIEHHPLLEVLQGLGLHLVALLLEQNAAREHYVAPLLVELDDLELVVWPISFSRLRMGRRSDLRPRRNALTPPLMVTERPPLTRWLMVPSMISSRSPGA